MAIFGLHGLTPPSEAPPLRQPLPVLHGLSQLRGSTLAPRHVTSNEMSHGEVWTMDGEAPAMDAEAPAGCHWACDVCARPITVVCLSRLLGLVSAVRTAHGAHLCGGKVELEEVEEAGEEVEEGLLDEVEGGVAEDRPWWLFSGHHSRASVANPISWPEG